MAISNEPIKTAHLQKLFIIIIIIIIIIISLFKIGCTIALKKKNQSN